MENKFLGFATFAVLIEALITYFNEFFVTGNAPWQIITSFVFGIVIAISYNLDLLEYLNFKSKFRILVRLLLESCFHVGAIISMICLADLQIFHKNIPRQQSGGNLYIKK